MTASQADIILLEDQVRRLETDLDRQRDAASRLLALSNDILDRIRDLENQVSQIATENMQ
jgi:hypothetical protein